MNSYRIDFIRKQSVTPMSEVEETDCLFDYLTGLYKVGQICVDYELIKTKDGYSAYVILPEDDALDEKYDNLDVYVSQRREKVKAFFDMQKTLLGENMDYDEVCVCGKSDWYFLYTVGNRRESPVTCGNCGESIPLYKLPSTDPSEGGAHDGLLWWQESYRSVDRLWMNSLSDRFTTRQISDPESQLAKWGREHCKKIEEKTGVPTFYYLHYDKYFSKKFPKSCPLCGNAWAHQGDDDTVDVKCNACRLVANDPDKN